MIRAGAGSDLAGVVSGLTVALTDDRHSRYDHICDDWNISNPEGYARWFESRMRLASNVLPERAAVLKAASIDDVPVYTWKTPLQQTVQLLKRHRDQMFRDHPDVAPISVIITTLAGRAYAGEADVASALRAVLSQIEGLVVTGTPRVPNPVDPNEDFADRWAGPEGRQLQLEANFWNWVRQAKSDFGLLAGADSADFIAEQARQKFAVALSASALSERLGLRGPSGQSATPKVHVISGEPAKPWRMAEP